MKTGLTMVLTTLVLILSTTLAAAERKGPSEEVWYAGGGVSDNDVSGAGDATGFQFFGGYKFDFLLGKATNAVEVGYMDSGEFKVTIPFFGTVKEDATGLWATWVLALPVGSKVDLLGRAGLDFGDDDGFMFGVGAGFKVSRHIEIRAEFVARDDIDSLQANFVYHP